MSERGKVTAIFSGLLALCLAGSAFESQILESLRPAASLEETLYISSPQALQRLSMGYGGLLADIYWTRAVQYFGHKHIMQSRRYDLLKPLLDITTGLDPHLIIAYRFGAVFLAQQPPAGAGQPAGRLAPVLDPGPGGAVFERILARNIDVEFVMRVFDGGDPQAPSHKARNQPGDQDSLAGTAPAGDSENFHAARRRSGLAERLAQAGRPRPDWAGQHSFPVRHVGRKKIVALAMAESTLDLRGLKCHLPALRTRKALKSMAGGALLIVDCYDPTAPNDIPHLVLENGDLPDSPEERDGGHILRMHQA